MEEKNEKTPEDLAAIAYLDKLRSGEGETMPEGLLLACVVKVIAYEEVPKAHEKYAMATVRGAGNREWRVCVSRYYLEERRCPSSRSSRRIETASSVENRRLRRSFFVSVFGCEKGSLGSFPSG